MRQWLITEIKCSKTEFVVCVEERRQLAGVNVVTAVEFVGCVSQFQIKRRQVRTDEQSVTWYP